MRSGAGAFCPGCRRLECLLDFFTRDLAPAERVAGFAALRAPLAPVNAAEHVPAVRSSAKPAVIDVRSLIRPRLSIPTSLPFISRRARIGNRTLVGFPLARHLPSRLSQSSRPPHQTRP